MASSTSGPQTDLNLDASPIIAALALCSLGLVFVTDATPDLPRRLHTGVLAVCCFAVTVACWLARGRPKAGRWLPIASMVLLVFLGDWLLAVEGLLALLAIPALLTASLLDLEAAALVAGGESVLLWLYAALSPREIRTEPVVATIAIWGAFAALWTAHRSLRQTASWAWDYCKRAQELLEQARDRKVELAQTMEDLAHANRQLALANERMAALRLIAEEAEKAKTAFVSRVSHEFRTPLNMIIGLVGLMIRRPDTYAEHLPRKLWDDLQIVHRNCEHLASMVNDVLDLTRVESGRLILHRELVDLAEVVDSALTVVRPLLDRKGLALQVSLAEDLPRIVCDRTRVRQVVLNLLSNAARFTERGEITVRAEGRAQSVLLSVSDTGPGITPKDAKTVFEPFWQAGATSPAEGGSGLGLSISKQFVELHGGRIWLESQPGAGTTCYVELPVSPPAEPADSAWRWIGGDWEWRERGFKGGRAAATRKLTMPRIVVCDETGALRSQLEYYGELAEFMIATDTKQARSLAAGHPAHAVVLNVADSRRLWAQLRTLKHQLARTALIGCMVPRPEAHALTAGAQGYLVKPVSEADLARALRTAGRPARRVLLVDDDLDFLALLTRMLQVANPEVEVFTAKDGPQALQKVQSVSPDLVFLDIVMPGMDGWQVLARLRRVKAAEELPVCLLSAQDNEEPRAASPCLVAMAAEGVPVSKILRCSLQFSATLWAPD